MEEHVFLSQAMKPNDVGEEKHCGIAIMTGAQVWRRKNCWERKELLAKEKKKEEKPQWVAFCVDDEKDCMGIRRARVDKPDSLGLIHFSAQSWQIMKVSPEMP